MFSFKLYNFQYRSNVEINFNQILLAELNDVATVEIVNIACDECGINTEAIC